MPLRADGAADDLRRDAGRFRAGVQGPRKEYEQGRARAFLDLLATRSQKLAASASPPSLTYAQLQGTAGRLGSTILSYWVAPEATYIWVVPPTGEVHGVRSPVTESQLRQKILAVRPSPDSNPSDSSGPAAAAWRENTATASQPCISRAW